jgi:glycosyltransferase involved in cell wall biosynthesis
MTDKVCFLINPNVMLITKQIDQIPSGGRELLCKLNHDALQDIYGERFVLFELPRRPLQGISSVLSAFKGHIDGLDESAIASALQIIQRENVGKVFVDGSNLGAFAKFLKKKLPQIEVTTFFHNVEARFFLGSLLQQKTLRALAVLMVNYLAERKSVRYSDKIICMSQRDSCLLQKVYGRPATHVSPMALQDKMPAGFDQYAKPPPEKFALFVGGIFYANRAGIAWFVKHVVPLINIKICIVGRGFEAYRTELEREGKVQVVGAVDQLADWYRDTHFVIAPIFDGSGMKTKVAEALMYGKKIVGTPEAFSGYEGIADRAGWCCATADDFVAAIFCAQKEIKLSFDPELRKLYEDKYSLPAAKARLSQILGGTTY